MGWQPSCLRLSIVLWHLIQRERLDGFRCIINYLPRTQAVLHQYFLHLVTTSRLCDTCCRLFLRGALITSSAERLESGIIEAIMGYVVLLLHVQTLSVSEYIHPIVEINFECLRFVDTPSYLSVFFIEVRVSLWFHQPLLLGALGV